MHDYPTIKHAIEWLEDAYGGERDNIALALVNWLEHQLHYTDDALERALEKEVAEIEEVFTETEEV